jgi:hypothetical protein
MQLYFISIIMLMMDLKKFVNKNYRFILISLLVLLSAIFRFWDLGYSDYIPDEYKSFLILKEGESNSDFFLRQRKGPMQFLVGSFVFNFSKDYKNELFHRLPFTIISIINVYLFYLVALKITEKFEKTFEISILASFIFSFNGFIFGFSRIAQYQNLNMFFSFLSILFFYKILEEKDKYKQILFTFISSIFFIFSFLSHWDAVFYLPLLAILIIRYCYEQKNWKKFWLIFLTFLVTCSLILGSLMYFYIGNLSQNSTNQEYLERRIEFLSSSLETYYNYIVLYNPFLFLWVLIPSIIFSFIYFKKYLNINLWFLIVFVLFYLFFKKPGTHIYNFLIPTFLMMGIFLINVWDLVIKKIPEVSQKYFSVFKQIFIVFFTLFIIYQTHILFVDHQNEYPFEPDYILFLKTNEYKYSEEEKLPLFGFPHRRGWVEINDLLHKENKRRGKELKYLSNEDDGISKFYLDHKYGEGEEFYYIGVKHPQNFIKDIRPRQYKIKEKILDEGSPKVKIWIVTKKENEKSNSKNKTK